MTISFALRGEFFSLAAVAMLSGIGFYSWRTRPDPGASWLGMAQFSKAILLLLALLAFRTESVAMKSALLTAFFLTLPLSYYFSYRLIGALCPLPAKLHRILNTVLTVGLGLAMLLVLLNPWTEWVQRFSDFQGTVVFDKCVWGAKYLFIYCQAIPILLSVLILFWVVCTPGIQRLQAEAFLVQIVVSRIIFYLPGVHHPVEIETIPLNFLVGGLISTWAFHHWRSLSAFPMAKEVVLRNMADGMLLVDAEGRIAEINQVMRGILTYVEIRPGERWDALCRKWKDLSAFTQAEGRMEIEVLQEAARGMQWYLVRRMPVSSESGRRMGYAYTFMNITRDKLQQTRLLEQEKSLSMIREREHLGREMHDGQGQILGYLSLKMTVLRKLLERGQLPQLEEQLGT
jgi:signal transduction histidine kinase